MPDELQHDRDGEQHGADEDTDERNDSEISSVARVTICWLIA